MGRPVDLDAHRRVHRKGQVIAAPASTRRRGSALDYALGVLAVLAVLALGWVLIGRPLPSSPPSGAAFAASPTDALYVSRLRMCDGQRNTSTKTCLVDGDTIWLHGVKYRMEGYDTPEPQSEICGGQAEVTLAKKASARLLQLLNANRWTAETSGQLDRTGNRTLITIRIGGRDVGDILIAERLARSWPNGHEWWCR